MVTDNNQASSPDLNRDANSITQSARWEEDLFQQISRYLENPKEPFFCRIHFLCTAKKRVYFLDTPRWWHTLRGDVSKVEKQISRQGKYPIDHINTSNSSRGWIPYFARKRSEELGVGWNDNGLIIKADDQNLLRRARYAQRKYLDWTSIK